MAMGLIAYSNKATVPPALVRINWTFNDGNSGAQGEGGALSVTGSTTVKISFTTLVKVDQTISFGASPNIVVGGLNTLVATATSGLEVLFSSTTPTVCTIRGSTITGLTAGNCSITASQAGNANYNYATKTTTISVKVPSIDGECGSSNGGTFKVTPAENFCGVGTASAVTGSTTYSWSCSGINGGMNASCSANVDSTGPALTLSTLADGAITTNAILNVAGAVSDVRGVTGLTINNTTVNVANGYFCHTVSLRTGSNTISIKATNAKGYSSTVSRMITLDKAAPMLTVSAPADNGYTNDSFVNINGIVGTNVTAKVGILENNMNQVAMLQNGTDFTSTVNLVNGINTITVTATDLSGKTSQAKRTVFWDSQVPSLAITVPPQDIVTTSAVTQINGTASGITPPVTIAITCDNKIYTPVLTSGTFSQQISFSAGKQYPITVTATDTSGMSSMVQRTVIYVPKSSGDMNGDGIVGISDALLALHMAVGLAEPSVFELEAGDVAPLVNGIPQPDGIIDVGDAFMLLRKSIGLVTW
jgi:hypothetical protein